MAFTLSQACRDDAPGRKRASMTTTAGGASGRILVVDDQPANLRVVGALLSRHGYEVQAADKGEDALALAAERTPDLLLLDMMMPGMDGFALLARLREMPKLQRAPVVFLTAAQDRDLLLRAFKAGAVDYVTKPFMPEELLARVDAHVGLKLTRDRLERVARERQELVNLVAHDLKNPLSSVLFASDMLLQDACRPERVPRYLQMIQDSTRDALGYIRRYLETQERRGARDGTQARARASLCGVVHWLVARYELQAEGRGMELRTRLPEGEVFVAMDEQVLRQVAENLVTNAIKYAAEGGVIDLEVRAGGAGFWQLHVADRGPGIPARQQRELFKPFTRLTAEDPAGGMSSGLGLSLARQIVADAGGTLSYEDRHGGGACFIIDLPEAPAA
jgi:two-component system, sensor histidine kinase and response regulator